MSGPGEYRVISGEIRCVVGEGPVWLFAQQQLFWVDILAPSLYRLCLKSGGIQRWAVREHIGWVIPRRSATGLIAGLRSGFAEITLEPFGVKMFATIPEHTLDDSLRLNDAKADGTGRIFAGSMHMDGKTGGSLYRLDPDRRFHQVDGGYGIPNGPTFNLDSTVMYHAETAGRRVYQYDVQDSGQLVNRRLFVEFPEPWGVPDGMTTDADGGVWIAHWGGSRVSRFDPDGRLERTIALPTSQITSCAFGGQRLDRMFVTSASLNQPDDPLAGAVFEVDPGCLGLPPSDFAG